MKELTRHTFGETPEHFKRRLAYALEQEEAPMKMKRKATIGIIAIAVLCIALACTALAVVFGNYEQVLEKEITKGYFDTWTADERTALVEEMIAGGMIQPDGRTEALLGGDLDEAAGKKLATEIVTEALGVREDLVGYVGIMEKIRGPLDSWTVDQKAEYSELRKKYGQESSEAEFYMRLREGDIPEEEAIRIAKAGVEEAFGLAPGTLDGFLVQTEFYRMKQGPQEPRWLIVFDEAGTEPGTDGHRMYTAVVSPEGELVDDPDRALLSPKNEVVWRAEYDAMMARKDAEGENKPQWMWTLEDQALASPHSNGFPGADDVPREHAVETAKARLVADGVYTKEALAELQTGVSFMIRWTDNMEVPFWCVLFVRYYPQEELSYRKYAEEMRVFVDAKTGEVVWYRGMEE